MSITHHMPIVAAILFLIIAIAIMVGVKPHGGSKINKNIWLIALALCFAFVGASLAAVLKEGPIGFWPEHTRNLWGNQIWYDLLLAILVAWTMMAPKAKAMGMKLPLWLLFIVLTGSIGLTAMLARVLYLQGRQA